MRWQPPLAAILLASVTGFAQPVLQSDPVRSPDALREYQRGVRAYRSEHFDEAIAAFHKVIKANPDFALAHVMLGHAFMSQRNYEGAVGAYSAAKAAYRRLQGEALERQQREFRE